MRAQLATSSVRANTTSRAGQRCALLAVVAKWLTRWDAYLDELEPAEGFKAERRAVIEATFARYRALLVDPEG